MAWDLRRALLAKGEFESARLDDFDFRQRVRTMRLLAPLLGVAEDELVALVASYPEDEALPHIAALSGRTEEQIGADYACCHQEARRQLIGEIGDPTPHRLA